MTQPVPRLSIPNGPPDTILLNGRLLTLDSSGRVAEAIAIREGVIQAVGSSSEIAEMAGPNTRRIELDSQTVMPSFFDSHNHMRGTGLGLDAVDLSRAKDIGEVLAVVEQRAAVAPPDEWIVSSGRWHEEQLVEQRFPNRDELDRAAPNHAVLLRRGGHNVVVNSRAFERASVPEEATNPPGGTFVRDGGGSLTGHVIGGAAFQRILRAMPSPMPEQEEAALKKVMRAYNAAGITSVIEPDLMESEFTSYRNLRERNEMTVRTTAMFRFVPGFTPEELERAKFRLEKREFLPANDPWLRAGGVKITADGGVETGFIREPFAYTDDPREPHGKRYASEENLQEFCIVASRAGWQVGIHCVGDAAIDSVLDAYEAAHAAAPLTGRRWALIHMMAAQPEHFPRARALDLVITAQQPLQYTLAAGFRKYWGPERAQHIEPLRAYLESGLIVGGGSDSPVTPYEPLIGIWSSVTRETHLAGVQGPGRSPSKRR